MIMNKAGRSLKIGLDYHGVINTDIEYFKQFCEVALARGHEIHILSGGPEQKIVSQLQKAKICFSRVFTIFDFYNEKGMACRLSNGDFYVDENLWNETKAEYCRQNNIDIQIDDSLIYGKYFTTPYCIYDPQKKRCVLLSENYTINFMQEAPEAIRQIEKFFSFDN